MKIELNLGTYLSILYHYRASSVIQKDIVGTIMHSIYPDFDESDDTCCSNLKRGKKNPKIVIVEMAKGCKRKEYPKLVDYFNDEVLGLLNPNCFENIKEALFYIIESDSGISSRCIVNPVTRTLKMNLRKSNVELSKILTGLFIYILKFTDNSEKTVIVKSLNDSFYKKIDKIVLENAGNKTVKNTKEKSEKKIVIKVDQTVDENDYRSVQRFCVQFENELGLLPLCQIAFAVSPIHGYARKMYTEYCLCSQTEKEMILGLNDQIVMDFSDKGWIDRCLNLYNKKIHETGICTDEFLYEGAKYFHRAFARYSKEHVSFDPYIFKPIYIPKGTFGLKDHPINLAGYVSDYLYLKQYKKSRKYKNIDPPLDVVWDMCRDFTEDCVTFWVCMMIISSCYQVCNCTFNNPIEEFEENDFRNINILDHVSLIDTQEDMYLYALLELYINFYNES